MASPQAALLRQGIKLADTLRNKPKGIDEAAHTTDSFEALGDQVTDPLALAAHTARGRTSFTSEAGDFIDMTEDQFVRATTVLDNSRHDPFVQADSLKHDGEFTSVISQESPTGKIMAIESIIENSVGRGTIKKFMQGSKLKLEKPLYVMRTDGIFSGQKTYQGKPDSIYSFKVVDPLDPATLQGYGRGANEGGAPPIIYKLPAGADILHPAGRADAAEVVITRETLDKSMDAATRTNYLESLEKGKALFGVGGVAAGVAAGSGDAEASNSEAPASKETNVAEFDDTELTGKVTGLLDQGQDTKAVYDSLTRNLDPGRASNIMLQALQPKIAKLREQGIADNDIMDSFARNGITLSVAGSLTAPVDDGITPIDQPEQPSIPEQVAADNPDSPLAATLAKETEGVAGFGKPVGLSADVPDARLADGREISDVIASINNLNLEYSNLKDEAVSFTGLSPAATARSEKARTEAHSLLTTELKKAGVNVESVNKYGEVMVRDPESGELIAYDETMIDVIMASSYEIGGAVMGAKAGFDLAPPHPVAKGIGTILGGAVGAFFGRGSDVYRHALELDHKVSMTELVGKMNDAAVADVTFAALGGSAVSLIRGGASLSRKAGRGLDRAWDLFVVGNKGGAQQTLKDVFDLNDAQVIDLVTRWEKITGNKLLSDQARETGELTIKDAEASMRAITETLPGAENVVSAATNEAKTGGAQLSSAIDKRAKDITNEAGKLTNDSIDVVLQDKLGTYINDTKDFFDQTKTIGTDLMKDSSYVFNFQETALVPAMRASAKGIHNGALRKDFYSYLDRIGELGGTPTTAIKEVNPAKATADVAKRAGTLKATQTKRKALAQATNARDNALTKARALKTPAGRKAAIKRVKDKFTERKTTIENTHLASKEKLLSDHTNAGPATKTTIVPGQESSLRGFTNLLELRKTLNEFRSDNRFKGFTDVQQLKSALTSVDKEIEQAALTHMPNGETWVKQWKAANTEYSKMKNLEQNVLFKTLTNSRVTSDTAVVAITKSMMYTDPGTFMQVMGKLPAATRKSVEGAVLKHLVGKHTMGKSGGKQALNLPALAAELEKVAMTQPQTRALKRTVSEFADVFKNDPHLLSVTGNVPLPKFQSYLTADPVIRAKFEFASTLFNAVKSRIPFSNNAGRAALVKNLGKLLDNPLHAKTSKEVLDALPDDPRLKTALHQLAVTFTEHGVPEHYGKVPIYRVHKPGEFNKAGNTQLGKGVLYYTDKEVANTVAKQTDSKVREVMQLHKRIATPEEVTKLLGREPTEKELKDSEILQQLKDQDFAGIAVGDKVMLFK